MITKEQIFFSIESYSKLTRWYPIICHTYIIIDRYKARMKAQARKREWKEKEKLVYLVSSTNVWNKENNSNLYTHLFHTSHTRKKREKFVNIRKRIIEWFFFCCFETIFTALEKKAECMISQKNRPLSHVLNYNLQHCFAHLIR
jgi:hypothetical protein